MVEGQNHMRIDNTLPHLYKQPEYGVGFLAHLIEVFNETGFNISVPKSIKDASREYIEDNTGIDDFIVEAFDTTKAKLRIRTQIINNRYPPL